jgi:hypothetical protein
LSAPQFIELGLLVELHGQHPAVRHAFGANVVVTDVFDVRLKTTARVSCRPHAAVSIESLA